MERFVIQYKETYGRIFFVEAETSERAQELVEAMIDECPDVLQKVEMEESWYEDITNDMYRNIPDEDWKCNLDVREGD